LGGDLSAINFDEVFYYIKPSKGQAKDWKDVPKEIKDTYDKLGILKLKRIIWVG
jgi:Fe-S cluster assembly protein SufB